MQGNTVRGFVVLEGTVGRCIQADKPIVVAQLAGQPPVVITLPPDTDPNSVSEDIERLAFTKQGGRLQLIVTQGTEPAAAPPEQEIATLVPLAGRWGDESAAANVSRTLNALIVDMSEYGRPTAHGRVVDSRTISVTFPDDATYTGTLRTIRTPRGGTFWRIVWSNGSAWARAADF